LLDGENNVKAGILIVAVLSAVICGCGTEGTRTPQVGPFLAEISPVRFLVLEVTPQGEPKRGKQCLLLRLSPHYGKIDKKSLEFRLEHETQELSLLTRVNRGYEIRTGEIIEFRAYQHLKFSPRRETTRHFRSNKPGGGDGK
jgi:hypothetical protein